VRQSPSTPRELPTPKERVLAKFPTAVCKEWEPSGSWYIDTEGGSLGWGSSPGRAWADAARNHT
jgi:hypothetical protein